MSQLQKLADADKDIYKRKFILDYTKESIDQNDYSQFEWKITNLQEKLNSEDHLEIGINFLKSQKLLKNKVTVLHSELEQIYYSEYTEGLYNAYQRAYRLKELLNNTIFSNSALIENSFYDLTATEQEESLKKLNSTLSYLEELADGNSGISYSMSYGVLTLNLARSYDSLGRTILTKTRESLSEMPACVDNLNECKEEVKNLVRRDAYLLYESLYIDL